MTLYTPLLTAAIATTLWLGGSSSAAAQTPATPDPDLETVTVVAPRVTYQLDRSGGGAPRRVRVMQQSAIVEAGDLDLSRIADMQTLETRVGEAAKRVCNELSDRYPLGEPEVEVCAKRASADAMARVQRSTRAAAGG